MINTGVREACRETQIAKQNVEYTLYGPFSMILWSC